VSLISRLLKANPSAQVSDMLTGYFVIPSAKGEFVPSVRAAFFGGNKGGSPVSSNVIDYITVETAGNAIDFGDLSIEMGGTSAVGSTTRGVQICGRRENVSGLYPAGGVSVYLMEYITFATTGNSYVVNSSFSASTRIITSKNSSYLA